MFDYRARVLDAERLTSIGAVLIDGPKGCGKTETALQQAKIRPAVVRLGQSSRMVITSNI
jgi:ATP-dependent Clp protease ATP-binding subunit ClpA